MISQKFFFMQCYGIHPIAPMGESPKLAGNWTSGEALNMSVTEPLIYTLGLEAIFDADAEVRESMDLTVFGPDDFNIMPLMTSATPPLMRNDLLAALQEAGVDNLELFQARVRNPVSNREYNNFSAFNIVGIADFDWARDLRRKINLREYRIKIPPFLIFYLFDDGPIVVHDTVRIAIKKAKIESVEFIPTDENY